MVDKNSVLSQLQEGALFIKFNADGTRGERYFYLCPKLNAIRYTGSKKLLQNSEVEYLIKDCVEVRSGFKTDTWFKMLRNGKVREQQEGLSLSILHSRGRKSLDLLASDSETRNIWIEGIQYLLQDRNGESYRRITDKWVENLFGEADLNRNGLLCKREVHLLLERMNVRLCADDVEQYFEQTVLRKAKRREQLNVDEFINFYKLLTYRPELNHIIHKYNGTEDICNCNAYATISQLSHTFSYVDPSFKHNTLPRKIVNGPPAQCQASNYLTVEELREFMQDEQQEQYSVEQIQELIHKFDPSIEGKKCMEMGVDGLREMLLSDVNELMNPVHKHTVYQDMTRPLTEYWINASHNTYLCANQVLGESSAEMYVRALKHGCKSVELDVHDGQDGKPVVRHGYTLVKDIYLDEILILIREYAFFLSPFVFFKKYPLFLNIENHCSLRQQIIIAKLLYDTFGNSIYLGSNSKSTIWPSPEQLKGQIIIRVYFSIFDKCICSDLAKFIYCENVTFKGFGHSKGYNYNQSSSLSETRATSLIEDQPLDFIKYNQRLLTRVYPASFRQNSSNVNAIEFWNVGAHMVALNFQTNDLSMSLNQGKFSTNGRCGYVLKPDILRQGLNPLWHHNMNFTVCIPELCLIRFTVKDETELLGQYCIPFLSIQQGYRHIRLLNRYNEPTSGTLFVKVKIINTE
ncbi:unnamed protein product [Didymodactylos carnosus]|uniref:Phosphoinositide phospholipase C n=1 Tax=Didymodactylos carnosus TaxID=1234261 RepID=A0A813P8X6_9BILA|nr:unnamed protein product [Didymodactylos carnosus]CAF0946863.1 unnamed protein product [Didymodactylos carnosus]CAF3525730.1 unnamed protein product [Didymodactylos carnosus]CAF3721429.1 unnamed protein product [Didymodactylos carnosus]